MEMIYYEGSKSQYQLMDLNLNEDDFPFLWKIPKTALDAVKCIRNEEYSYFRITYARYIPSPLEMWQDRDAAGKGSRFKIKPV